MKDRTHEREHRMSEQGRYFNFGLVLGICWGIAVGRAMEQQRRAKADYERATRQRLDNLERRAFLEDHPDFALPDEAAHQRARAAHPSVVKEDPPS